MSKPEDHLVRTAAIDAGMLALSRMTGLSRLDLKLHRLPAAAELSLPAGTERFLYVLEGSGTLRAQSETAESITLNTGDFVSLTPAETAELSSDPGINILLGQSLQPPET